MILFSIANVFMNRPSEGVILKPSLEDEPQQESVNVTNTITGKYFKLKYDSNLDTVSNISEGNNTALEVYRVARSDAAGRRTFVITIKTIPSGGVGEESSFKLREINPQDYTRSSETIGELDYIIFEKKNGAEITAFVTDGGERFAILAYTVSSPGVSARTETMALFSNFSWNR